jgi:hypothetical protein
MAVCLPSVTLPSLAGSLPQATPARARHGFDGAARAKGMGMGAPRGREGGLRVFLRRIDPMYRACVGTRQVILQAKYRSWHRRGFTSSPPVKIAPLPRTTGS